MSEQKSSMGLVAVAVAAVALVGLIGWDQVRQHAPPHSPAAQVDPIDQAAVPPAPEPVPEESVPLAAPPAPAPTDSTGASDRQQMPAGTVLTI